MARLSYQTRTSQTSRHFDQAGSFPVETENGNSTPRVATRFRAQLVGL